MNERQYPIHLRRIGEPEIADYLESMVIEVDTHEKMFLEMCEWRRERDALLASVPKWISVSERLPTENGCYLTAIRCPKGSWIEVNDFDCLETRWDHNMDGYSEDATKHVTHWMPLPETPEVTVDATD